MTPADLHDMEPEDRTRLLKRLASTAYRTKHYKAALARDLGIAPSTVQRWHSDHNTPISVILLMDQWANATLHALPAVREMKEILLDMKAIAGDLNHLTKHASDLERFANGES